MIPGGTFGNCDKGAQPASEAALVLGSASVALGQDSAVESTGDSWPQDTGAPASVGSGTQVPESLVGFSGF